MPETRTTFVWLNEGYGRSNVSRRKQDHVLINGDSVRLISFRPTPFAFRFIETTLNRATLHLNIWRVRIFGIAEQRLITDAATPYDGFLARLFASLCPAESLLKISKALLRS